MYPSPNLQERLSGLLARAKSRKWISALSARNPINLRLGNASFARVSESSVGGIEEVNRSDLASLAEALLSRRGEALGPLLAKILLSRFAAAGREERVNFLLALLDRFGVDAAAVARAMIAYQQVPETQRIGLLHVLAEPRRLELFRRLNQAPGGTADLVAMREFMLGELSLEPKLKSVDADFLHLFSSWFNQGFLTLRRIDWDTSAKVLERIVLYEAVHAILDWRDLRNRVASEDRRCYAFFHQQLPDEPLIFVEVALTKEPASSIQSLLTIDREPLRAQQATTAVFYSISNTQKGLAGVSFGNFLIKQVVDELKREFPALIRFVTLSPMPRFSAWVAAVQRREASSRLDSETLEVLDLLQDLNWPADVSKVRQLRPALLAAAADYFIHAKDRAGRPLDPVARFHLSNGARLERINMLGDVSPKGLKQSHGLMVNYLYRPDDIASNHEAYAERGKVILSPNFVASSTIRD